MKIAKKGKKYLFGYISFFPITIFISIVIPIFVAKQITYINSNIFDQLLICASIILIIELTRNIVIYFKRNLFLHYYHNSVQSLSIALIKSIFNIENIYLDTTPTGKIIERVNGDCSKIPDSIDVILSNYTQLLSGFGICISTFIISKILFAFLLICSLIMLVIKHYRNSFFFQYQREHRIKREQISSFTAEIVRGFRDIKVLNANQSFINTADNKFNDVKDFNITNRRKLYLFDLLSGNFYDVTNLVFIILAIILLKNNMINAAGVMAVYLYRDRILSLFNALTIIDEKNKEFQLSCDRIFELIDSPEIPREHFGNTVLKKANGDFEFKNVFFSYKDDIPVLKDLSFKVNANETVAFVGKSGTGKTTIFNLISKLYDINSGEITIDNININDLTEDSIRGNMTIINQSPYIFNMSIRDNLKLVNPKCTKKDIDKAIKTACLDEFVNSLPDNLDTVVGEGGINLSGGQRQRLAIARALIQKTEIILFDEATSALDNETQERIQEAINNLKGEYTILIIAHRFSTVINSDKIFFMEDGSVKASGTHKQLLKISKAYKELYTKELQK